MNSTKKKKMGWTIAAIVAFMLVMIFAAVCERDIPGEEPDSPGPNQIWLENSAVNPKQKTISVGTEITWINKDLVPYTIISGTPGDTTDAFKSNDIGAAGAFSHTFNDTGTYNYFCDLHPEMRGTIIVE